MLDWIKTNAILLMAGAITLLVSALSLTFVLWRGAEHDAQVYRDVAQLQGQVIQASNRISEHENQVSHTVERITTRVMESPNASTPIPPDIADAWLDGIDSLRHSGKTPVDGQSSDVPGPRSGDAGEGGANTRHSPDNVSKTGSSISKLQ